MAPVRVAGSIGSLKVAVALVPVGWPVAPSVGPRAVIVGAVVSPGGGPEPQVEPGVGPVAVVVPAGAVGVDDEAELAAAGQIDGQGLGRAGPGHDPAVGELDRVGPDLEAERAVAADLVVEADLGRERRAAGQVVADLGRGVDADALRVDDPGQGQRPAVGGARLAVAAVLLGRPEAVADDRVGEVRQVAGGPARRCGGRERPAAVGGERVAGDVLDAAGAAADGRDVGRGIGQGGARVEGHGPARTVVGDTRRERRRGALDDEADGGAGQGRRIDRLAEGGGRVGPGRLAGRAVGRAQGGDRRRGRVAGRCGGRERPAAVGGERVAGDVLDAAGAAADGRDVGRGVGQGGARVEGRASGSDRRR